MASPGRKGKLTDELQAQIVQSVEAGLYAKAAAAAAGIHEATYHDWLKRGREARENGRASKYRTFLEAIEQAEARAEQHHVLQITRAAAGNRQRPGDWKAAAWLLERKYPDRYGKREGREISGPNGGPVEHQVTGMASLIQQNAADEEGEDG